MLHSHKLVEVIMCEHTLSLSVGPIITAEPLCVKSIIIFIFYSTLCVGCVKPSCGLLPNKYS